VISPREKHELQQSYASATDPRVTIAKCVLGLLALLAIALLGLTVSEQPQTASAAVNASQDGTDQ
jgi:hypothetical protein